MSKLKSGQSGARTGLVGLIRTQLNTDFRPLVSADTARGVASLESLLPEMANATFAASASIQDGLKASMEDAGMHVDNADTHGVRCQQIGLESAAIIALASGAPSAYAKASRNGVGIEGLTQFGIPDGGNNGQVEYATSVESFDTNALETHMAASVAFNLLAPRQDEFGEKFFPTEVATPDQAFFKASIARIMVFDGATHKTDGSVTTFKKRNLVAAFRDAEILKNEATDLVPAPSGSNTAYFVDAAVIPNVDRIVMGETIPTRPLKIGAPKGSLLAVSSHPGLIASGLLDQTDQVAFGTKLAKVYILVEHATNDDEVIAFDTTYMPGNQFLRPAEGQSRETRLGFRTKSLNITGATKQLDGSASVTLAGLAANVAFLEVNLDGDLNVERGDFQVRAGGVGVARIVDASGNDVSTTGNATINAATFTVIGYDLKARRTNSNRRSRGQLLDLDTYQEAYAIPVLAPISINRAVADDGNGNDVTALVNATHVRIANSAVTTLLNYADALKAYYQSGISAMPEDGEIGEFEGIGRMLVAPFFEQINVNMEDVINSMSSKDKRADIQGFFTTMIGEVASRAAQVSGYIPALRAVSENGTAKPTVLIGTDIVLSQYLMLTGDDRLLGPGMASEVVSSPDSRMTGKIIVTFTQNKSGYSPLNFGNMIWIPELVGEVNVSRGGSTVKETMVQPRFRHIANLPVMAVIEVSNLDALAKARVVMDHNVVSA